MPSHNTLFLLPIKDASNALGVCRSTFYKLLDDKNNLIETVKIGSRRLVVEESLKAYVKNLQSSDHN